MGSYQFVVARHNFIVETLGVRVSTGPAWKIWVESYVVGGWLDLKG